MIRCGAFFLVSFQLVCLCLAQEPKAEVPTDTIKQAEFIGLGGLPPQTWTTPKAISDDGSVVVGTRGVHPDMFTGFFWTSRNGMMDLDKGGGPYVKTASHVDDVSADGTVLVGGGPFVKAEKWTEKTGWTRLADLGRAKYASGSAISSDGTVVVGTLGGSEAFRWSRETGMVRLGFLDGCTTSVATDVSDDGTVVVGSSSPQPGRRNATAFRWSADKGMIGIVNETDREDFEDFASHAHAISADGSTVVGSLTYAKPGVRFGSRFNQAFLWTEVDGLIRLDHSHIIQDYPKSAGSVASDVCADGSIIVGTLYHKLDTRAFIWDKKLGMRLLEDTLEKDYRLGLRGYTLTSATSISRDGQVIVGAGIPGAWLVRIPKRLN